MMKLLSKNLRSSILIALAFWIAGTSLATANPTSGSTDTNNTVAAATSAEPSAEQINQATEATEVKPGDWAYKTLQALGNKYSCNNTPNGTQTLSREEFATSLNGCVQSME
jgi:hypothetical protein